MKVCSEALCLGTHGIQLATFTTSCGQVAIKSARNLRDFTKSYLPGTRVKLFQFFLFQLLVGPLVRSISSAGEHAGPGRYAAACGYNVISFLSIAIYS